MKKIVFVCLGNICRSPMAEFVMKELDQGKSLHIESRATSSWEHGNPVHQGTQKILRKYATSVKGLILHDKIKPPISTNHLDLLSKSRRIQLIKSNNVLYWAVEANIAF